MPDYKVYGAIGRISGCFSGSAVLAAYEPMSRLSVW